MTTKIDICNLALSRLGNKATIETLDTPRSPEEKILKKWYDITRQTTLRRTMPSFAIRREIWAKADFAPEFGYQNAYLYRPDCLKILGIGNLYRQKNDYSVEGKYLCCDAFFEKGIPVRYIRDEQNTTLYPPDFVDLLSFELAYNICSEISDNVEMLKYIQQIMAQKRIEFCSIDSQENKPIRISHTKYDRTGWTYHFGGKK